MIFTYKIGLDSYNGRGDVNGGLYEYKLIKKEVDFVAKALQFKCNNKKALILVGGYLKKESEIKVIEKLLNVYFDVKIFIATDYVSISTCKDIINKCDYLLTQTTQKIEDGISKEVKQLYSGVPELFYKYIRYKLVKKVNQDNKIIFGGANTGRQDLFERYEINEKNDNYCLFTKINESGYDNRIGYFDFIEQLQYHKYTVVISRDVYRDVGWVTPRYYEALAANCLPFIDSEYDKNMIYNLPYWLTTQSYRDIMFLRDKYDKNERLRKARLAELKESASRRTLIFSDLLIKIINEEVL